MSYSTETGSKNPAKKFIQYKSDKGFFYYDKEKGENVSIDKEMYLVILDSLATIKGFHAPSKSGIYSNEVRNSKTDKLTVKAFKGGEIASGLYQDIKANVKMQGGKFNTSLYCALINSAKDIELVNLSFSGSGLTEFSNSKARAGDLISVSVNPEEQTNGMITWKIPTIKVIKNDKKKAELHDACVALDKELQDYLSDYFHQKEAFIETPKEESIKPNQEFVSVPRVSAPIPVVVEDDSDELPF
jgi:hypothetical protein